MAVKAIFFDVDGTLFSHTQEKIPASALKALAALKDKGIKSIIATGRHITELEELKIASYFPFDAYVTLNGQYCYNDQGLIYDLPINREDVQMVIDDVSKKHYPVIFVERDKMYINIVNDYVQKVQQDISSSVPPVGQLTNDEKIYQMIVYQEASDNYIRLPHCAKNIWHAGAFDLIPKSGGKEHGIKEVLRYYNIRPEETMAFGDAYNDIGMLEMCGIGVAMGNGNDEIKKHADYITTDIDDNGIYNALKYFKVIEEGQAYE